MDPSFAVVTVFASDVAGTAHFYRDVLGLRLVSHHGDRPHFAVGSGFLVILRDEGGQRPDPPHVRFPAFALAVEELDAYTARLREHGVDLPWGVEGDPESRYVMFRDPSGTLIELVERPRS
jgi:catechol 2,3-dioxygenase-like lactoylglutathione lyase family enzyme